jgi:LysM repeat protein
MRIQLALLVVAATSLPTRGVAQQLIEGGMRITRRNVDTIVMSSGSSSGIKASGSASVPGGEINVGSAASEVNSELNPVTNDTSEANPEGVRGNLFVAGSKRQWAEVSRLQRRIPTGTQEIIEQRISQGHLDDDLRVLIQNQPGWVDTVIKENPDDPAKPLISVQFSEHYDRLVSLLAKKDANNTDANSGTHIYTLSSPPSSPESPAANSGKSSSPAGTMLAWHQGKERRSAEEISIAPQFTNHGKASTSDDVLDIANLQNAGTNKAFTRFTILGFSTNPDPRDGKTTSLSAFATNNRTVGSIRIPADSTITLQQIADQYGTNLAQLMQVNNITNAAQDITGLSLTVPADFSTVGSVVLDEDTTPTQVAQRYGISVAWLLDLNGLTDPEQQLSRGASVYLPGLRPLGSPTLPAAKPSNTNLEYADYGAYTNYSVTYHVEGSLVPLFTQTLFNTLR